MDKATLALSRYHKRALVLAVFTAAALLICINWRIAQFEQLLQDGQVVRFALAPVDPRSIMQGIIWPWSMPLRRRCAPRCLKE